MAALPVVYVTATDWCVSYTTGTGIDGAILNVHRWDDDTPNAWGGRGVTVKHPDFDGIQFPSRDDAVAYAAEVGLLKPYVRRVA